MKKPRRKLGNFGQRLVTGTIYIFVLLVAFLLKLFVSDFFFDAIILAFSLVGTWEMTRAFKDKMHASQKSIVMVFAALIIITYAVSDFIFVDVLGVHLPPPGGIVDHVYGRNYAPHITFVVFMAGVSVLMALLVFAHEKVSLESTGCSLLCYVYPSFFLVVLTICNHLEIYSELALLFVFVISPFADVFAYCFGRLFGKYIPAKMAPSISPNKTMIGGLGGLIGGAIGAVVVFFISYGLTKLDQCGIITLIAWNIEITPLNLIFFIGLGVLTAAFSQFGDLVESAIKRKIGIKDMGKILPGHGGILDRIDSSLYAGLIVCLAIVVRVMLIG